MKGCVPPLLFLDPGGPVSDLVDADGEVDERKCRLVVSLHIIGDILHVRGFGDRVPAPFPPVHDSVVVYIGRGEDAHCTVSNV